MTMLNDAQLSQLRQLQRDLTKTAPADEEFRLVASGFPSKPAAHEAMITTFLPLMKKVDTSRFGLVVRPMFDPVPPGTVARRRSGWGVFLRDRRVCELSEPQREMAVTQSRP
jgi:hypothetical protein